MPTFPRAIFATILFVLTSTGCGTVSLGQVKQFGAASSALGDHASKAFELVSNVSVDRNLYDVAGDPANGPKDSTFEGLFSGGSEIPNENKERSNRLALRLNILAQITNYSDALRQLAEADISADIDEAAKDLNGSLIGLRDSVRKATASELPITDTDIGLISTAVNAIGKGVAEAKRRHAIKTLITRANPAVQKAIQLVAMDLGKDSQLSAFVKEAISNSRGSLQQAYNLERVRPDSTFEARYSMLVRARQLFDAESNTVDFFSAVSDGASAVGRAHQALCDAAESHNFSSAKAAILIGELELYAQSVQAFHKSIQPQTN